MSSEPITLHQAILSIPSTSPVAMDVSTPSNNNTNQPAPAVQQQASNTASASATRGGTARAYCFTLNNPEGLPDFDHPLVKYAIYQEEIGEEGTYHLQGYVELKKPVRWTQVRTICPTLATAHFEPRRGTPEQARAYCMKGDAYINGPIIEFGCPICSPHWLRAPVTYYMIDN